MKWRKEPGSLLHIPAQLDFNGDWENNNMLLKMDIEGAEWKIFESIDLDIIIKFSQIVIEFHGMSSANIDALNRINEASYLGHVHGNNYGPIVDGISEVIECTYIRKDCLTYVPIPDAGKYPIPGLDYPNNPFSPDFKLNYWQ